MRPTDGLCSTYVDDQIKNRHRHQWLLNSILRRHIKPFLYHRRISFNALSFNLPSSSESPSLHSESPSLLSESPSLRRGAPLLRDPYGRGAPLHGDPNRSQRSQRWVKLSLSQHFRERAPLPKPGSSTILPPEDTCTMKLITLGSAAPAAS